MTRHILVPLDGTPLAETILPAALRVASRTDANLTLLTVVNRGAFVDSLPNEAAAFDYLDRVRETLSDSALDIHLPLERIKLQVAYGSPGEEVGEHSQFEQASLIMMTTHGRNPSSRLVMGSVASKLLQRNVCPVILFKAGADVTQQTLAEKLKSPGEWLGTTLSNRVVLTLDGTEISEGAIPQAVDLARNLGAELYLLGVIEPSIIANLPNETAGQAAFASNPEHEQVRRMAEARLYLGGIAQKLMASGLQVRTAVERGNPAVAIHNFARRRGVLVTVMATRSGEAHHRFRLGSVADQVLDLGGIPVLIVPNFQVHPTFVSASAGYQYRAK
jgi:nucleotide-binding universal stress UspA family protein